MVASLAFLIAALARTCVATRFLPGLGFAPSHALHKGPPLRTPLVNLWGPTLHTPGTVLTKTRRLGMQVDDNDPFDSQIWPSDPLAKFATARNDTLSRLVDLGDTAVDSIDALEAWISDTASPFARTDAVKGTPSYLKLYRNNLDEQRTSLWAAQNWGDKDSQEKRFSVFADEIDFRGKTILDVGCGQGDFGKYLQKRGIVPARLRGIDGVPEFVESAQQMAPRWAEYVVGDVVADSSVLGSEWDFIILSGSLSTMEPALQKQVLAKCWRASRRGMAFNFLTLTAEQARLLGLRAKALDSGGIGRKKKQVLWKMRRTTMINWANRQAGAKTVKLIDDYAPHGNDATIIIRREDESEDKLLKSI